MDVSRTALPAARAVSHDRRDPLMVVYIAGDGRSGSTLLDRLIGIYPNVFSCGELGNLVQSTTSAEQFCACGAHARDCDFWTSVLTRWSASVPDFTEREYRSLQRRFERLRRLFRPRFPRELNVENPRFARYAEYTRSLFDAIADLSGAEVIVDSSKSPARALALSRVPGIDLRMLHLVRDVRGVTYSLHKVRSRKASAVRVGLRDNLRFVGTWALINYCCERVRARLRGPSLFTRYEDYTADPDGILAALADLMGCHQAKYAASASRLMRQGHQVAGNDARLRPVQTISTDEVWRRQFGFAMRKGLYLLALPLMLRYRYRP
ncbi:MAG TPA: sulfotransferase [Gammaproteobacteria bacterium]|nr:sulfotransferase [Gammaproteobacteria bacterium]